MRKTVDAQEIQKFSGDSSHWWDEDGPFAPLHRLNPLRLSYIRKKVIEHYGCEDNLRPFRDLTILDIGCGGGLISEPLSRLGANVTGIDADRNAVTVAQEHGRQSNLKINYESLAAETLAQTKEGFFDVVLALEIAEHVADLNAFVSACSRLCKPDGMIVFSTLNRTAKSFLLGIVAAEYILRWVPTGTHNWKKFIKPSELVALLEGNSITPSEIKGINYNPLTADFYISEDVEVNYFLLGTKQ